LSWRAGGLELADAAAHTGRVTELVELAGLAGLGTAQLGSGPGWAIDWGRNDPAEANFNDPDAMKVVTLDAACRQQQLAEGWFQTFEDVPERALTLTIPTLLKVPKLIVSVPGLRKAQSVRRTLAEPISTECPATILRLHPDVTIYLDLESASELNGFVPSH